MEAELQLQDTSVSPDLRAPSSSGSASSAETPGQLSKTAPQAAKGGTSAIKSATSASLCGISNGMRIAGGATHAAASRQVYDHAKRAASPAGSASQGPPNIPAAEDEAAEAQNDLLPSLSKLAVPARDSQKCSESSDASSLRALPESTGTLNVDRAIHQLQDMPENTRPRTSGSQLSPISILDGPSHMQAVAAGAAGEHSQAGKLNIYGSTDQHCPIPDLLGQQQKRTEVITAAAATEETPSNKRDSTKSFLTMSSVFDSASEDTAITADEESQNAAFSQAISMDDMEGWVRLDI
ncbi:hypothetical protein ARSEF4850_007392 [Beauveria asiatica]